MKEWAEFDFSDLQVENYIVSKPSTTLSMETIDQQERKNSTRARTLSISERKRERGRGRKGGREGGGIQTDKTDKTDRRANASACLAV